MSLLGDISQQTMALLDEDYLAALAEQKEHDLYAKIISLDIDENPVDEIEGLVTGGSVNLDGDSSVRRTCSIQMVAKDVDIKDYYWTLKTKFKLELGLSNNLTEDYSPALGSYPYVQWFSMGTYVIGSFSTSISGASCNISISGKDKMCMLNGDLGGQLFASIDFGTEEKVTRKFTKVTNIGNNSSALAGKYYYILNNTSTPATVLQTDELYRFGEDNNGNWYLLNYQYIYDNPRRYTGIHYNRYQQVRQPNEMFKPLEHAYEPGKYYYLENGLYKLNSTSSAKSNDNNYELRDLYEIAEEYTIKKIPLEKIIREAVHAYALEPYHNIVINDVDKYGLEQLQWRGDKPLIMIIDEHDTWQNVAMADQFTVSGINMSNFEYTTLNALADVTYGTRFVKSGGNWVLAGSGATSFYRAIKVEFGEDVGYRITDLVYPSDLITSIGETLTSMLDKIKNMLGEFEYFYDTNGRFIFQRKRIYVNTSWTHFTNNNDEKYVTYSNDKKKLSFNFEGNRLFTAIQNTPNLTNLRNDYSVWGKRTTASGAEIPIHARYAIDKKPVFYRNLQGEVYAVDKAYTENEIVIQGNSTFIDQLNNFQLYYPITSFSGFSQLFLENDDSNIIPTKTTSNQGYPTWSKGWWDIRDWQRYYSLLTNEEQPQGTMKWYSHGKHSNGTITEDTYLEDLEGSFPTNHFARYSTYNNSHRVWLVTVLYNTTNNTITQLSLAHGSGSPYTPTSGRTYQKQTYKKYRLENGQLSPEPLTEEEQKYYEAYFDYPYYGCSVEHTYTYFLQWIQRNTTSTTEARVFFYNPDFPGGNEADIINQHIKEDEANAGIYIVDWREIIYQMAIDYFAGQGCTQQKPLYIYDVFADPPVYVAMTSPDEFLSEVAARNPNYFPSGYTGYEQYYTDMEGFWRQLYNPKYNPIVTYTQGYYEDAYTPIDNTGFYNHTKEWQDGVTSYVCDYYIPSIKAIGISDSAVTSMVVDDDRLYWHHDVFDNPESLNFWIEFLDAGEELSQFQVSQVGIRSKVVNADKASAIVFKDIPEFIFYDPSDENYQEQLNNDLTGYKGIQMPKGLGQFFTISYRNLSVKNKIDELLFKHGYCIENISLTAIPIFSLEPNTRIYVCDRDRGIEGEYLVSKIGFSLNYNGTMSITANKAPERLY